MEVALTALHVYKRKILAVSSFEPRSAFFYSNRNRIPISALIANSHQFYP